MSLAGDWLEDRELKRSDPANGRVMRHGRTAPTYPLNQSSSRRPMIWQPRSLACTASPMNQP